MTRTSRGAYFKKLSIMFKPSAYVDGRVTPMETKMQEVLMGFSHYVDQGDDHAQATYIEIDLSGIADSMARYQKANREWI